MSGVETPWVRPPVREVLSIRVMPEVKASLDEFTAGLRAEGWNGIQKHHVLEHLMQRLLTEEGRAEVRRELEQASPR